MNSELLLQIADAIEAKPELYDQGTWGTYDECGTKACIAGWATSLSGYYPTVVKGWNRETGEPKSFFTYEKISKKKFQESSWNNESVWPVDTIAEQLLDLSAEESMDLFEETWEPAGEYTVPEALRALASGVPLEDVTHYPDYEYYED